MTNEKNILTNINFARRSPRFTYLLTGTRITRDYMLFEGQVTIPVVPSRTHHHEDRDSSARPFDDSVLAEVIAEGHAREHIILDQNSTSTKNKPAARGRRERRERGREGGPTYLCRTGIRGSAVPRKTTSPARCAPARRPRSSARRWGCCCCSYGGCYFAGPAS